MEREPKTLAEHKAEEHQMHPLANIIKPVVYGGNDGIVTTFAVVAGFSGASLSADTTLQLGFGTVLLFGVANLFADALSMGLGDFLSGRAEADVYRAAEAKEAHEIAHNPDMEAAETIEILEEKGFSADDAAALTALYQKNPAYWTDWMMHHELEMDRPDDNPLLSGTVTFLSFIVFGAVPLIPFLFGWLSAAEAFSWSVFGTFMALVGLGIIRWRVSAQPLWRCVAEALIIGGAAAVVAYLVGILLA